MSRWPTRIAAVVLDMDGLVIDTEPIYKVAWQRAAAELGYELDDAAYFALVGRVAGDCERQLIARFGPGFQLEAFRLRWSSAWRDQAESAGISMKTGLLELLAWLEERHIPIAVATSSDRGYVASSLGRVGLLGRFATIVTGDEVPNGKPAPDIYLEAARRLGVRADQSIALEDSDAGILSAAAAGMVPLLIPDVKPPSAEAAAAAFRVLGSLNEARQMIEALVGHEHARADDASVRS